MFIDEVLSVLEGISPTDLLEEHCDGNEVLKELILKSRDY